jgi:cbb3-type cytochrome oxidase maturation protein
VKAGQFDDLEGPGEAILMDDDTPQSKSMNDAYKK